MPPEPSARNLYGGGVAADGVPVVLRMAGHGRASRRPLLNAAPLSSSSSATDGDSHKSSLLYSGKGRPPLQDWGYPGYLSQDEFAVYEQFREVVNRRDKSFRSAVFSFGEAHEDEAFALCRWLRARKFVLADVVRMVEQACARRSHAVSHGCFPDPHAALGVEAPVYHSQYPQFYYSHARGGFPLFVSKVGVFNPTGLECVTTAQGIFNFHWHDMQHDYVAQLRRMRGKDPTFRRYETVIIMDLAHLTPSQVTKRALNIIKVQSEIDSLCFPETLHRLVIINAPGFFSMTWKMIRNWVDERTAEKVIIMGTNRGKWISKLRELVDEENLPIDYGGRGVSTEDFVAAKTRREYAEIEAAKAMNGLGGRSPAPVVVGERIVGHRVHLFSVRSHASHSFTLAEGESMRISVFTRSLEGGSLRITGPGGKKLLPGRLEVRHAGTGDEEEEPTRVNLNDLPGLRGPGRYKFRMDSNSGPFSVEHFLLVGRVYAASGGGDSDAPDIKMNVPVVAGADAARVVQIKSSGDADDSSEEDVMGGASSLCSHLCNNNGIIHKDPLLPAVPLQAGGAVVVPTALVAPASFIQKDPLLPASSFQASEAVVIPTASDAPAPSSPQSETRSGEGPPPATKEPPPVSSKAQDAETNSWGDANVDEAAATPGATASEKDHAPAPALFMCGAFSGAASFLGRLWCGASVPLNWRKAQ